MEEQKGITARSDMTENISVEVTGMKAGLITCGSLIIYFMIMRYFNFMNSSIAWGMNFLILLSGIILAYRYYRSKTKLNIDYIPGLVLGSITTAAAVIPFVVFVYIYFSQADIQPLLLKGNILFMAEQITPVKAAASVMIEGICSGVVISFMMMQYFRSGFRRTGKELSMHG